MQSIYREECFNFSLLWEPLLTSSLLLSILFSINNSLYLARNLFADIICSKKQFAESVAQGELRALRNRLCSRTNIGAYFLRQVEAIVLIFQIFFATRAVLKIGEYPRTFPGFSLGIFGHMTRFDQSRASENI